MSKSKKPIPLSENVGKKIVDTEVHYGYVMEAGLYFFGQGIKDGSQLSLVENKKTDSTPDSHIMLGVSYTPVDGERERTVLLRRLLGHTYLGTFWLKFGNNENNTFPKIYSRAYQEALKRSVNRELNPASDSDKELFRQAFHDELKKAEPSYSQIKNRSRIYMVFALQNVDSVVDSVIDRCKEDGCKHLDLSNLNEIDNEAMKLLLSKIPRNIESVTLPDGIANLRDGDLDDKLSICSFIPPHIKRVDAIGNKECADFLKRIPSTVSEVTVGFNGAYRYTISSHKSFPPAYKNIVGNGEFGVNQIKALLQDYLGTSIRSGESKFSNFWRCNFRQHRDDVAGLLDRIEKKNMQIDDILYSLTSLAPDNANGGLQRRIDFIREQLSATKQQPESREDVDDAYTAGL